jgi:hypothetical protein
MIACMIGGHAYRVHICSVGSFHACDCMQRIHYTKPTNWQNKKSYAKHSTQALIPVLLRELKCCVCFSKVSGIICRSVCLKNNHWVLISRLEVKKLISTIAVRQRYFDSFVCTVRAYTVKKG